MADQQPIRPDYESQTIRITDHAVTADMIEGKTYSNCHIIGPAVLAPIDGVNFTGCGFDVANNDPHSILFVTGPRWLVGIIGLKNCGFFNCRFTRISLVVDEAFAAGFVAELQRGGPD